MGAAFFFAVFPLSAGGHSSIIDKASKGVMASLTFKRLNDGWNAYPNGSESLVETSGDTLVFRFELNPYVFDDVEDGDMAILKFSRCSRWRLGPTNDEGWFRGQCRYSGRAPAWGEFYELLGDDPVRDAPSDWHIIGTDSPASRHFLFYLKDETFECMADDWRLIR